MLVEYQNHKGKFCWIRENTFCQEGNCGDCQIYQEEKLCPTCKADLKVWAEMGLGKHKHYIKEEVNG